MDRSTILAGSARPRSCGYIHIVTWTPLSFFFFAESDTLHPCQIPSGIGMSPKILPNRILAPESHTVTHTRAHVTLYFPLGDGPIPR